MHQNRAFGPCFLLRQCVTLEDRMTDKQIVFSGQVAVPAIGQGTWYMGERASHRKAEVSALRAGVDQGLTLIDTAEMYAEGGAEEVVGEALVGLRDRV